MPTKVLPVQQNKEATNRGNHGDSRTQLSLSPLFRQSHFEAILLELFHKTQRNKHLHKTEQQEYIWSNKTHSGRNEMEVEMDLLFRTVMYECNGLSKKNQRRVGTVDWILTCKSRFR